MRADGRLLVLATTAAGVALALLVTLLQDSVYRADASIVLVRQGQPPGNDPELARAAAAAEELLDSRAVAESAVANLRLDEPAEELLDRVEVESEPGSSLVRVVVEAPSAEAARRAAQEVAEIATVRFNERFSQSTRASIWEPARAGEDRVSPRPARALALGALLGALAGWIAAASGRRPPRLRVPAWRPRLPQMPKPAGEAPPPAAAAAAPAPAVAPAAAPARVPPAEPGSAAVPAAGDVWTLGAVERLLAEHGGAFPERLDELRMYADSFRDVAAADGSLPAGVGDVVEEVFAPLVEQARLRGR